MSIQLQSTPGVILGPDGKPAVGSRKDVPPAAQVEILTKVKTMTDLARDLALARQDMRDFIEEARKALGIQSDEFWDIADDASYFTYIGPAPTSQAELNELIKKAQELRATQGLSTDIATTEQI